MRLLKPLILSTLFFSAVTVNITTNADSLTEIYELTLVNDPTLSAAEAAYLAGKESANIGRAGLLPQISVVGSYSESESNIDSLRVLGSDDQGNDISFGSTGDIDTDTESVVVSLSQPIFNASAWFQFKQGKQLSEQARLTFTNEKQQQMLSVADAYFNVLRSSENLSTALAEDKALERQLQQTTERFEVGLLPITDVHEAQAVYDNAVVNTLEAKGALNISFESLEVLSGQPHQQLSGLTGTFPSILPEPLDVNDWVNFALTNNPNLKASKHAAQAAGANASAKKSDHLPTVTGKLSYSNSNADGTSLDNLTTDDSEGSVASIEFRMPIFSGGLTSANRRQAQHQAVQAEHIYEATRRNTVQQTRSNHLQVVTNVARVKARLQAITSAESALEATQAGYEVGTRNIVDVLNVQRTLFQAKRDYANARYDYINSYLNLKRISGQLSPEDLATLNKWLNPGIQVVRAAP